MIVDLSIMLNSEIKYSGKPLKFILNPALMFYLILKGAKQEHSFIDNFAF